MSFKLENKIMGFDIGMRACGVFVLDKGYKVGDTEGFRTYFISTAKGDIGRIYLLQQQISKVIADEKPDYICCEKVFASRTNRTTIEMTAKAIGILELEAYLFGIEKVDFFTPLQVKRALSGNTKADKKIMLEAAKWRFPNLGKINDHQADSSGVALCGYYLMEYQTKIADE